ncbi:RNA polymerase sigma factor [Flammeovirga aprica]|uniref:Sigma-70 family RNA polymerase sigma factor n=1 Tax=Flammeovirga aprica JL-4 TaxID=694437 RepID=A0A7X9RTQ9_9BACT|nr:sigma-70 family RNA polymerase sigma factor [Flammeovirga aprica]NME67532.1 sigma-70 family RNA polymerase sigma factor [Flammeovirga aprica JL-4]
MQTDQEYYLKCDDHKVVSISELFLDCYPHLYRFGQKMRFKDEKIEDAIHEVFINLIKRIQIDDNLYIEKPKPYLFSALRHQLLRGNQQESKLPVDSIEEKVFDVNNIKEVIDQNDNEVLLRFLDNAIGELPPRMQEAFRLSREEGFTYKEIGQIMKISSNTVENHIAKAFQYISEKAENFQLLHQ